MIRNVFREFYAIGTTVLFCALIGCISNESMGISPVKNKPSLDSMRILRAKADSVQMEVNSFIRTIYMPKARVGEIDHALDSLNDYKDARALAYYLYVDDLIVPDSLISEIQEKLTLARTLSPEFWAYHAAGYDQNRLWLGIKGIHPDSSETIGGRRILERVDSILVSFDYYRLQGKTDRFYYVYETQENRNFYYMMKQLRNYPEIGISSYAPQGMQTGFIVEVRLQVERDKYIFTFTDGIPSDFQHTLRARRAIVKGENAWLEENG